SQVHASSPVYEKAYGLSCKRPISPLLVAVHTRRRSSSEVAERKLTGEIRIEHFQRDYFPILLLILLGHSLQFCVVVWLLLAIALLVVSWDEASDVQGIFSDLPVQKLRRWGLGTAC
ncbi:hypothetical protein Dimus_001676, partial [Dionaea muscipula]